MFFNISLRTQLSFLVLFIPLVLFGFSNSADTTISVSDLMKLNPDFLKEDQTNSKIYKVDTTLKVVKNNNNVTLEYGDMKFEGVIREEGLYEIIDEDVKKKIDKWIIQKFPKLEIGVFPSSKTIIGDNENGYNKYKNNDKGWQVATMIPNLGIQSINYSDASIIKGMKLRNALFNTFISVWETDNSESNIIIMDNKLEFFDKPIGVRNKIYIDKSHLEKKITIPLYKTPISTLLLWIAIGALLIGLITFAVLFFNQRKKIVLPYKKAYQDLSPKITNEYEDNYSSFERTPGTLFDFLRGYSSTPETLSEKDQQILESSKEVFNEIENLNKEEKLPQAKLEFEKILVEKFGLNKKLFEQAFPTKKNEIEEILKGSTNRDTQLEEVVKHVDKTYSSSLIGIVTQLQTDSEDLEKVNNYFSNKERVVQRLKTFAENKKPTFSDLSEFLSYFKFNNLISLKSEISNNKTKVENFDNDSTTFTKKYKGKAGLDLISDMSNLFELVKKVKNSSIIDDLKKSCLNQLSKAYLLEQILAEESPHSMELVADKEYKNLQFTLDNFNITPPELPQKKLIIDAFVSAKNAEENKTYLTNYYNRFKDFFDGVGKKKSKDETNQGWFVQQLIEMSMFGFALSTRIVSSDVLDRDKRFYHGNYVSLLKDKSLESLSNELNVKERPYEDLGIAIRTFVEYAKRFHIPSLKNILIEGHLFTDEVYQKENGIVKRYSKSKTPL